MSRNAKLFLAAVVLIGLCTTLWAVFRLRSVQLDDVARNAIIDILQDNPSGLYALRFPEEETRGGLSEATFNKMWDRLVRPRLAKVEFSKEIEAQSLNDPPTEGVATVMGTLPDRTDCSVGVTVWNTSGGPKMALVWDLLMAMWILDYAQEHPMEYNQGSKNHGDIKLAGFRHDRAELESLGLKGIVNSRGELLSLDKVDESLAKEARGLP